MSTFRSIILIALLAGQAAAFMTAGKTSKSLTTLESYNRNYNSMGGYGNERYMDGGMMGGRHNDYTRGYENRGYNEYNRGGGGYNSYDRGYGGGMMSRSKYGDWLNGSSNYIPTSADRNFVMDRGYETSAGRYSNYYGNGDRYNTRFNGGGSGGYGGGYNGGYGGGYERGVGPMMNNRYNEYNRGGPYNNNVNRGYNEYDRYSPVGYNNNNRYSGNNNRYGGNMNTRSGSYNRDYDRNYDRSMRSNEYDRTYRSPMDSHRQTYPNYGMGGMEDQFGMKKWWDSN